MRGLPLGQVGPRGLMLLRPCACLPCSAFLLCDVSPEMTKLHFMQGEVSRVYFAYRVHYGRHAVHEMSGRAPNPPGSSLPLTVVDNLNRTWRGAIHAGNNSSVVGLLLSGVLQSRDAAVTTPAPYDDKGAAAFSVAVFLVYGVFICLLAMYHFFNTRQKEAASQEADRHLDRYLEELSALKFQWNTEKDNVRKFKQTFYQRQQNSFSAREDERLPSPETVGMHNGIDPDFDAEHRAPDHKLRYVTETETETDLEENLDSALLERRPRNAASLTADASAEIGHVSESEDVFSDCFQSKGRTSEGTDYYP